MLHEPRLLVPAVGVAAALALAACGSDGGSGAVSVEEFCAEVEALQDQNADSESEMFTQADVDQMRDLADQAPESIRADVETMAGAMAETMELDPDDLDAVFEILFAEDVLAASGALETFAITECGFDPSDESDGAGDEVVVGGDDEGAEPDDTGPGVFELQDFVEAEYGGAPWVDRANGWYWTGGEWTVDSSDWAGDAMEMCSAVTRFLVENDLEGTVRIREVDAMEGTAVELAVADESGVCAAL